MQRADLGDAAGVEHGDAVGDLRGDAEVVGDEDDAAADLVAKPCQQSQHLRLHRDVQGGGRLVGDDQIRIARDGDGDHHPLTQAAGEFVGKGTHPSTRFRNADRGQQAQRLVVTARGLGDLLADAHGGVQGGHRVLEHRAQIQAPNLANVLVVTVDHVGSGDGDGAVDPGVFRKQSQHAEAENALARARFTDQAEDFPRCDLDGHAAEGVHVAAVAPEGHV